MKLTNGIPVCEHCNVPTKRTAYSTWTTDAGYRSVYNEEGDLIKFKESTLETTKYYCHKCNQEYDVSYDGKDYKYI